MLCSIQPYDLIPRLLGLSILRSDGRCRGPCNDGLENSCGFLFSLLCDHRCYQEYGSVTWKAISEMSSLRIGRVQRMLTSIFRHRYFGDQLSPKSYKIFLILSMCLGLTNDVIRRTLYFCFNPCEG